MNSVASIIEGTQPDILLKDINEETRNIDPCLEQALNRIEKVIKIPPAKAEINVTCYDY